jgi:SAM-dependent methyltransferase
MNFSGPQASGVPDIHSKGGPTVSTSPQEITQEWARGAQAIALLAAVHEQGWTTFLREPRDPAAVAGFAEIPVARAEDVLAALAAHGIVAWSGGRYRLTHEFAEALFADTYQSLGDAVLRQALTPMRVRDAVRTGQVEPGVSDFMIIARSVAGTANDDARRKFAALLNEVPELAEPIREGRFLDVGCGVAGFTLTAATMMPKFRATALEVVPELAAEASRRAVDLGVGDRVDIVTGDARRFDEPGAFDACFWAQAFFPRGARAETLAMIHRSLRPGGTLVAQEMEVEPDDPAGKADFAIARLVAQAQEIPFAPSAEALRDEMTAAGFVPVRIRATSMGRLTVVERPA